MKWMRARKDFYKFVKPGMVIRFWDQDHDTWYITAVGEVRKEDCIVFVNLLNVMNRTECLRYPLYCDDRHYTYSRSDPIPKLEDML